jgi:hypothetical protein
VILQTRQLLISSHCPQASAVTEPYGLRQNRTSRLRPKASIDRICVQLIALFCGLRYGSMG